MHVCMYERTPKDLEDHIARRQLVLESAEEQTLQAGGHPPLEETSRTTLPL
jgi:hypothetical protein